ncbi:hypothetical protein P7C70_g6042, partial [Phenoliferia sp. Uapishka_3]
MTPKTEPQPEASTSTLPTFTPDGTDSPEAPTASAAGKTKRKKLPSCDSCKLRRVLCIPQPPPTSCPRCKEKGIVCTTTPVVRRKPTGRTGKRIEEARATFGIADGNLTLPPNAPWIPSRIQPRVAIAARPPSVTPHLSSADLDARLGQEVLSGDLVAHLIDLYQHVPQSWLPLIPRGRLALLFESSNRHLAALSPQTEVLVLTIIALTSRLSSHPVIIGPGGDPAPDFESLTPAYLLLEGRRDLGEFGRRRENVCEALREKAVRAAWERGTLVNSSEESMAACHLLEMLEGRNDPKAGKPYGSAFVSHLRTLVDESDQGGAPQIMNMPLGWSALIMREALFAANAGRTSHFAAADDLLLCGPVPPSIDEALLETVDDVDVRDSVTLFFRPMRPSHARKQPLDERFVSKLLTQLDSLFQLLSILDGRISFVLSAAATSAHALPGEFETQRQYIMRACIYTLQLAWSSLSLPVYTDLRRRIALLKTGPPSTSADRRRTRERLELLLQQVYRTTIKGARMVASCVHGAPSLAFLTHLHQERLESWIEILLESRAVEDGGEGITRAEKQSDLQWMLDGVKNMSWSWTDKSDVVTSLESGIAQMSLSSPPPAPDQSSIPAQPFDITAGLDFSAFFPSASGAEQVLGGAGIASQGFDLEAMLSSSMFGDASLADMSVMGGMSTDYLAGLRNRAGSGVGTEDEWMNTEM